MPTAEPLNETGPEPVVRILTLAVEEPLKVIGPVPAVERITLALAAPENEIEPEPVAVTTVADAARSSPTDYFSSQWIE